jgi:hypothetical protein
MKAGITQNTLQIDSPRGARPEKRVHCENSSIEVSPATSPLYPLAPAHMLPAKLPPLTTLAQTPPLVLPRARGRRHRVLGRNEQSVHGREKSRRRRWQLRDRRRLRLSLPRTPPTTFHRNQLNLRLFVHLFFECQNFDDN